MECEDMEKLNDEIWCMWQGWARVRERETWEKACALMEKLVDSIIKSKAAGGDLDSLDLVLLELTDGFVGLPLLKNGEEGITTIAPYFLEVDNIEGCEGVGKNDNATLKIVALKNTGTVFLKRPSHVKHFGEPFDQHFPRDSEGSSGQPSLFSSRSVLSEVKRRMEMLQNETFESTLNFLWWLQSVHTTVLRWTLQGWSLFNALLVSCGLGAASSKFMAEIWATPADTLNKIINFIKRFDLNTAEREMPEVVGSGVELGFRSKCYSGTNECYKARLIPCISCRGWPTFARDHWEEAWPPKHIIEKIQKCSFVLIPTDNEESSWVASFPKSEAILLSIIATDMMKFSVLQFLEAIVANIICPPQSNAPDLIGHYHIRTLFFWELEKPDEYLWTKDSIAINILTLLRKLKECLERRHLEDYFVPNLNLFEETLNVAVEAALAKFVCVLQNPTFHLSQLSFGSGGATVKHPQSTRGSCYTCQSV